MANEDKVVLPRNPNLHVRIEKRLLAEAQKKAAIEGRTLAFVVRRALKRYVSTPPIED